MIENNICLLTDSYKVTHHYFYPKAQKRFTPTLKAEWVLSSTRQFFTDFNTSSRSIWKARL